jgi:hypothetical protein
MDGFYRILLGVGRCCPPGPERAMRRTTSREVLADRG